MTIAWSIAWSGDALRAWHAVCDERAGRAEKREQWNMRSRIRR